MAAVWRVCNNIASSGIVGIVCACMWFGQGHREKTPSPRQEEPSPPEAPQQSAEEAHRALPGKQRKKTHNHIIERPRQPRSKRSVTEQPITARPPEAKTQGITDVCEHRLRWLLSDLL